ncbi:MAG: hypothetical protein ACUVT4_04010 [Actinomycetota bacterium]
MRPKDGLPVDDEPSSLERIKGEITGFFAGNPFLLVSEDWLAFLLCRPVGLVERAVLELVSEGTLGKRDRHVFLETGEEGLAHAGRNGGSSLDFGEGAGNRGA